MEQKPRGLTTASQIVGIIVGIVLVGALLIQVGVWTGGVDDHVKTESKFMAEFRQKVDELVRRSRSTMTVGSPIQLTKLGENVSATVRAPAWAEEHAVSLAKQFKGVSAYDIQTYSFQYAQDFEWDQGMDTLIKKAAFEEGISRGEVIDVLGIELRNEILCMMDISVPDVTCR